MAVWVQMQLPRDNALLQQVSRREALTAQALVSTAAPVREEGKGQAAAPASARGQLNSKWWPYVGGGATPAEAVEQGVSQALTDESELAGTVAAMPVLDRHTFLDWQRNEGGLSFFKNLSKATGASLVSPDGREFLPNRFMIDTGADVPVMDLDYGRSLGLTPRSHAETPLMRMADGEMRRADAVFDGVTVVLAKGTPHESRCIVHFLAVKGLVHLAEVLFPAIMDHQFGGVGVDRYRRVYKYRPKLADGDDVTIGEVPVECWRYSEAAAGSAAAIATVAAFRVQGQLDGG
jgi:hypothetical protein